MFGIDDAIVAGVGGSLIGGALGLSGQRETNSANAAINQQNNAFNSLEAAKQRDFNAQQAQNQMDFQQYNADTQWQRGVKDMQAAGLSPMLAYMKGGNAAPVGSAASSSAASAASPIAMGNSMSAGLSGAASAATVANTLADTVNKQATKGLIDAQIGATGASADFTRRQTEAIDATVDKVKAETERLKGDTNFSVQQDILKQTAFHIQQQGQAMQEQGMTTAQVRQVQSATIAKMVSETKLNQLDIDAAGSLNLGREYGQVGSIIKDILNAIRVFKR